MDICIDEDCNRSLPTMDKHLLIVVDSVITAANMVKERTKNRCDARSLYSLLSASRGEKGRRHEILRNHYMFNDENENN